MQSTGRAILGGDSEGANCAPENSSAPADFFRKPGDMGAGAGQPLDSIARIARS
jgi:hypothetical protein